MCVGAFSLSFSSSCSSLSVMSSDFGTFFDCASSAVTNISNEPGKLASKCTNQSSSFTTLPITVTASKISVILFMCLLTDPPSLSFPENSFCLSCNLVDQVFHWNCSSSFLQTVWGFLGSPSRYVEQRRIHCQHDDR